MRGGAARGSGRHSGQTRCKQRAGEGSTADWEQHGEERTANMSLMVVTLEVSKLSGWLNADAPCRESKGGHAVWGEVCRPAGAGGGGRRRCRQRAGEGSTADWGQGTGRSARRTCRTWL